MPGTTLYAAFIDEHRDTYDAGRQLTKALPRLAKAARSAELRTAFETRLEETHVHMEEIHVHIDHLERVFEAKRIRGKHCEGMAGTIEEGKRILQKALAGPALDACLIAAGPTHAITGHRRGAGGGT